MFATMDALFKSITHLSMHQAHRLNVRAFAFAFAIFEVIGFVFVSLISGWTGWGQELVSFLSTFVPWYGTDLTGLLAGIFWGIIDGLIAGAIFASLYNWALGREGKRPAKKK